MSSFALLRLEDLKLDEALMGKVERSAQAEPGWVVFSGQVGAGQVNTALALLLQTLQRVHET